jgi:phage N-6-adenine-methyltransferase
MPNDSYNPFGDSTNNEIETPNYIFDPIHREFEFTLDVCATPTNAKVDRFYSPRTNGLIQDWSKERCWCNPPYGRGLTYPWVQKSYYESLKGALVVCLLPSRTEVKWFHQFVLPYAEIRYFEGRIKFVGMDAGAKFASLLAIFRPR